MLTRYQFIPRTTTFLTKPFPSLFFKRFGSKEQLAIKVVDSSLPKIPLVAIPTTLPNTIPPCEQSFASSIETPSSNNHQRITPEMLSLATKFVPGKLKTISEKLAEKKAYDQAIAKLKTIVITNDNIILVLKELGTNPIIKYRIKDKAIETTDTANELDLILINIFDNILQKVQPNPISQDIIEAFMQLITESLPPLQENIVVAPIISYADVDTMTLQQRINNFLSDIKPKRCFTDQEKIHEIARLKELLYLLKQENNIAASVLRYL